MAPMNGTTCRLCGELLLDPPALTLERVPVGAQAFLDSPGDLNQHATVDLILAECAGCGLLQLRNQPVAYYREVITASSVSATVLSARRQQFCAFIDEFGLQGKKVIEVGCGKGHLLDTLEELGVQAWGLESGSASVAAGRAHGRRILEGYPGETTASDPIFDAFFCFNFLEHSPHPGEFLKGVRGLLKDGAVGIVEVPNFDNDISIQRHYDLVIDHLLNFTSQTLGLTLAFSGFDVLSVGTCWDGDSIRMVVRKSAPSNYQNWKTNNPVLGKMNDILADPESGRVAVWGASHEGLTLVSMVNHLPVCILDSAQFKQGKYEPSRGIPIVAPGELESRKIDTVIVLAAIYSEEVVQTLVHRMGFCGNIFRVEKGLLVQVQGRH